MSLPYVISNLLYVFDDRDRTLLLERIKNPNKGMWSPCGGKLDMTMGESPYRSACREAYEELGMRIEPSDLNLVGLVTESGYLSESHWMMFLFEIKPRLNETPPAIQEGRFEFFDRDEVNNLTLPMTDREFIWPMFWKHRNGFFSAHCHCTGENGFEWTIEETR